MKRSHGGRGEQAQSYLTVSKKTCIEVKFIDLPTGVILVTLRRMCVGEINARGTSIQVIFRYSSPSCTIFFFVNFLVSVAIHEVSSFLSFIEIKS